MVMIHVHAKNKIKGDAVQKLQWKRTGGHYRFYYLPVVGLTSFAATEVSVSREITSSLSQRKCASSHGQHDRCGYR